MISLRTLVPAVVVVIMAATACQRSDESGSPGGEADVAVAGDTVSDESIEAEPTAESMPGPEESDSTDSSAASGSSTGLQLAEADLSLPPARGINELAVAAAASEPVPTSISIERIGLSGTTVRSVGVENNGDMTVPPPLDVGWYRYGPTPGEAGSAVLAGHIASGGIPGAFRHLDRLEAGDLVTVGFDDGSSQTWMVDELLQVDKTELPFDTVFARSGPSKLALITCGGEFDYDARSYTDNVVVTASPITG